MVSSVKTQDTTCGVKEKSKSSHLLALQPATRSIQYNLSTYMHIYIDDCRGSIPSAPMLQIIVGSPIVALLLLSCLLLVDFSTSFHIPKPSSSRALNYASLRIATRSKSCTARPVLLDGALGEITQSLLRTSQG